MSTFREAALAGWEAQHGGTEDQARVAIVALLDGHEVTFDRVSIVPSPSGVMVVFADTDGVHLAAVKTGESGWRVHLVRRDGDELTQVGPSVTTLAELWEQILSLPPVEPSGPPEFRAGEQVATGDRRTYQGTVYEVLQPHTTAALWSPDVATSLWREVA